MVALCAVLLTASLVAGTYGGLRFYRYELACDAASAGSAKPGLSFSRSSGNQDRERKAPPSAVSPRRFGRGDHAPLPLLLVDEMSRKESR